MQATNEPANSQNGTNRSGTKWPWIVVAMLAMNVGVCAITVAAVIRNPVRVESDYYDKAVRWDELRELDPSAVVSDEQPALAEPVEAEREDPNS